MMLNFSFSSFVSPFLSGFFSKFSYVQVLAVPLTTEVVSDIHSRKKTTVLLDNQLILGTYPWQ